MSKHSLLAYFHPAPSLGEAQACLNEIRQAAAVLRKPRISKLEPYIPLIAHYLINSDASLQQICAVLKFRHDLQVDKTTLFRFIRRQQQFTGLRTLHPASAPTKGSQP